MKVLLAIDIGGSFVKFGILNQKYEILDTWKSFTNIKNQGKNILKEITFEMKKKIKGTNYQPISIGIGVPGFADGKGKVFLAGNLGWKNYDVKKEIKKYWKIPFAIHNDVQMHAFGEKVKGEAVNNKNFILIALGTGVGGAIFINDELYLGNLGCAGEVGHIPFQTKFKCSCGLPECIEPVFSATGLINIYNDLVKKNTLDVKEYSEIDAAFIIGLANRGEKNAIKALDILAHNGGKLCGIVSMILCPEKIILSGGMLTNNQKLVRDIKKYYKSYVQKFIFEKTEIVVSKFANDSALIGAAHSGYKKYLEVNKNEHIE